MTGLAASVVPGAVWYGHDWWTVGRFIESTDDAYVGGDVTVMAPKVAGFITGWRSPTIRRSVPAIC